MRGSGLPRRLRLIASRPLARRRAGLSALGATPLSDHRRLVPTSRLFGFDRGRPVDRYYIEHFVRRFGGAPGYAEGDLQGVVLEVGGSEYSRRFGTVGDAPAPGVIHRLDVLHVDASNPEATVVGDLLTPSTLPSERYDCIVCTQTLHVLYDMATAVGTLHGMLKPGGVLLATAPGISSRCKPDADKWGDYWRLTSGSAKRLFGDVFGTDGVRVDAYGNVASAVAFLRGLSADELTKAELDLRDLDYEVIIGVRAQKAA